MNLRWTILGVILLTFVGLVLILSVSLQSILVPHFRDEEDRSARLNVQRVLGVLENERISLTESINNWAVRDESYDFVRTGDPDYIRRNLSDSMLIGLNIDLLAFVSPQGNIVYVHLAGEENSQSDMPAGVLEHIQSGDELLRSADDREPRSGLLSSDLGPLLVVSAPLLKTSGEGPAAGTLLIGRLLDADALNRVSGVVRFPLALQPYDQPDPSAEIIQAIQAFSAEDPITAIASSDTQMTGYALLNDFYGNPAFILQVEQGRSLYRNSQLVLQYLYTAMVMGALLFSVMTFLALDRLVLARVRKLGTEVTEIGAGGDLSARVTVDRPDELSRVGVQINGMLENLQGLSHRLVEIQESERRRIALELHDEIGQLLTGLKLQLDSNREPGTAAPQQSLAKASALADELIQRVRNLSLDLRPTMLDDLGLLPALFWHIDRFTSLTGVKVNFSQNGLADVRFAPEIETTAYRIIQEALTNVARHSGVNEASVQVLHLDGLLSIQVEDRGGGFSAESAYTSRLTRGLRGMQERVALVGGSITIDSVPGWGTSILVELPGLVQPQPDEGSENDHGITGG
ncbi:MAG TPA: CHASE4 domain-containing protein [Bellilinea sp.]|nr:CHASE4 domain-containing protein [Bellilinea sp.]